MQYTLQGIDYYVLINNKRSYRIKTSKYHFTAGNNYPVKVIKSDDFL